MSTSRVRKALRSAWQVKVRRALPRFGCRPMASAMPRLKRSTRPLVCGRFGLGKRWTILLLVQRTSIFGCSLAARPLRGRDWLAGALLVDEIDESGFVLVFELVRFEMAHKTNRRLGSQCQLISPPATAWHGPHGPRSEVLQQPEQHDQCHGGRSR
jgi:hypothetical protein